MIVVGLPWLLYVELRDPVERVDRDDAAGRWSSVVVGRNVAVGVGRLAELAQAHPVGAGLERVAVGVGVGRGGLGQQGRRGRAARGAAVGPALLLVRTRRAAVVPSGSVIVPTRSALS